MIPPLAPLFQGAFASYRDVLTLADDPRAALPARVFLSPAQFAVQLARFAPEHAGGDPRARLSLWSKYYFRRLLPPVLAASFILDWRLPLALDTIEVVPGADGLPEAFKLPHGGAAWASPPPDPFARFAELLDGHLQPLIQALAAHSKAAPRLFWGNAGDYFDWCLGQLAALALPAARLADGRALLASPLRPDGARNPLFEPVRYLPQGADRPPWRQRRGCCILDLLGLPLCDDCPRRDAPPA